MKYHCDLSPLVGAYCPYCTNDEPLCEFDKCDIEEAHEAGDEETVIKIHNKILIEQKIKETAEKVYRETSVVKVPIDYIGIGNNTKWMPLQKAVHDTYKELEELKDE